MESQAPSQTRFKVYTATIKSLNQSQYHLSTFNKQLQAPEELPKIIKEETVTIKARDDTSSMTLPSLVQQGNQEQMGVVVPEPKRDKIKKIYTYEETTADGKTIKYQGKDSTVYSGTSKNRPNQEPKLPDNDFQSSNYALMIYDQKKNAFRLVPINRHIQFER